MRKAILIVKSVIPIWLGLFTLLPICIVIAVSFVQRNEDGHITAIPTLYNYERLLDPLYFTVMRHSLEKAGLATIFTLVLAYPFAYHLSQASAKWRPFLLTLVILPFWTNSLVRTYAIRSFLAAKGMMNQFLLSIGLIQEPVRWLYTDTAVMAGLIYVLFPFMILPIYSSFEKLDRRLLEAAADLGATFSATFFYIVLPLTMPGVVAGCLLVFLPALGLFYVADILGGGRELLIGNFLKDQFLDAQDWPFGAAASLSVIGLLFALLGCYVWIYRKWTPGETFGD